MSNSQQPIEKGEKDDADSSTDPMLPLGSCIAVQLSSESLLRGRREVLIRHGTEQYRLSVTRMNKLILTK